MLLPFGLISDLDSFIGVHRATFHNLFIILIPLVLILFRNVKEGKYLITISALTSPHVFLDAFETGVFLLYPVSATSYDLNFWLELTMEGFYVILDYIAVGNVGEIVYNTLSTPETPKVAIIGSGSEPIIFILSIIAFFFKFNKKIESE